MADVAGPVIFLEAGDTVVREPASTAVKFFVVPVDKVVAQHRDVFKALINVCRSNTAYLLTTTFASRRENRDIATGQWRPLNLELQPFCLPKPLEMINEECTEGADAYIDKSLALWRIEDIRRSLQGRRRQDQ